MVDADTIEEAATIVGQYRVPVAARDAFAAGMSEVLLAAALRGYVPDRAFPVRHAAPAPASSVPSIPNAGAIYQPLPFDEALEFWRGKIPVAAYDDLVGKTWLEARVLGFKVAGITEATVLQQLQNAVGDAVAGRTTVDEFVRDAQDTYGIGARHAEIVIRTNVQTAYNWGHYQQLTDPDVLDAFPWWGFDVVLDGRTSDICRPLAGKAYRHDDPVWDSLYPPNHHQCRTQVVPLSEDDLGSFPTNVVQADGTVTDGAFQRQTAWPRDPVTGQTFMPSPGFQGNVGKVRLQDTVPTPIAGGAV